MKNRKLIKIITAALTAVLTATVLFGCFGSDLNKANKMIKKSCDKFAYLTTQVVVTDGTQDVYKYTQKVEIIDGNAEIRKATSKLNSSFEFSTVEDVEFVENVNKNDFINFVLSKDVIEESKFTKSVLNLVVKADKTAEFLNANGLLTDGNSANATFTFENGTLKSAEITFNLQSGKKVVITMNCEY